MDRVSTICRELDEQLDLSRHRPLEDAYPYLWLYARHVKVRDHGRVVSEALVVAYAVHEAGEDDGFAWPHRDGGSSSQRRNDERWGA